MGASALSLNSSVVHECETATKPFPVLSKTVRNRTLGSMRASRRLLAVLVCGLTLIGCSSPAEPANPDRGNPSPSGGSAGQAAVGVGGSGDSGVTLGTGGGSAGAATTGGASARPSGPTAGC